MDQEVNAPAVGSASGERRSSPTTDSDWSVPRPERLPRPTWVPAALAVGIVFLLWGIATTWVISAVGFVISTLSLGQWIREMWYGA